ncbi:MAG: endonuclease/exonuclease/phosphatase family protein, partial [Myxococcota bacterium]
QARNTGEANLTHLGSPAEDTSDFGDSSPGNLRVDYVLPSRNLSIVQSAVFWPPESSPLFPLAGESDHRLVWVDLK